MTAVWLWARADLRRRWPSLVLLAVLLAIPIGAVLALVAGARRADSSVDRFAEATEVPEIIAFIEDEPTEFIERVQADGRVSSVQRSNVVAVVPEPMEPGQFGFSVIGGDETSPGGSDGRCC